MSFALVNLTLGAKALVSLADVKSASVKLASSTFAFVRSAFLKIADWQFAFVNIAPGYSSLTSLQL